MVGSEALELPSKTSTGKAAAEMLTCIDEKLEWLTDGIGNGEAAHASGNSLVVAAVDSLAERERLLARGVQRSGLQSRDTSADDIEFRRCRKQPAGGLVEPDVRTTSRTCEA